MLATYKVKKVFIICKFLKFNKFHPVTLPVTTDTAKWLASIFTFSGFAS